MHYLLECEYTISLRRSAGQLAYDVNLPDAKDKATAMVYELIGKIHTVIDILTEYPPPR